MKVHLLRGASFFVTVIALGLVCPKTEAQPVDLAKLSLEELSQVKVSVASSRQELIRVTPAIVSSINLSEMRSMGVHNVEDMLSMLPSFGIQDGFIGNGPLMIRGVSEAFNQKVLFMLDGVPYWQPAHSDIPLRGIALVQIEKIEVIRGPGAVIYGTNATGGVINIITKGNSGESKAPNQINLSAGSNDRYGISTYLHVPGEKFQLHFAAETADQSGYEGNARLLENSTSSVFIERDLHREQSSASLWLRATHPHFDVTLHHFRTTAEGVAGRSSFENAAEVTYYGTLAAVAYSGDWQDYSVRLFGDFNQHYLKFDVDKGTFKPGEGFIDGGFRFVDNGDKNTRRRIGFESVYEPNPSFSMSLGAELENRETGQYESFDAETGETVGVLMPASKLRESSVYLQGDYQTEDWRIVFGARYTDNQRAGSELMPRASFIYQLSQRESMKFLYSIGFNSPNFVQQYIDIPGVIVGNENNQAETVSMYDIAYTYSAASSQFVANIFRYDAEHFIQRQLRDSEAMFTNAGNFSRSGFELDYQYRSDNWSLLGNMSYHHDGNSHRINDNTLRFVPRWSANAGLSYRLNGAHSLGGSLQFVGERAAAESFTRVNVNYRYTSNSVELDVTMQNLFGRPINSPDIGNFSEEIFYPVREGEPTLIVELRWAIGG